MKEVWKDIDGYDGKYQISNLGRVRKIRIKMLKPSPNRGGYPAITLSNKDGRKTHLVHRLVAKAFVPNPRGLDIVNHLDECPANSRADNLEWVTQKENCDYGTWKQKQSDSKRRYFATHPQHNAKPVLCVELNTIYPTAADAERLIGVNRKQISACLRKVHKTAGGYHWEYATKEDFRIIRRIDKQVKERNKPKEK